MVRGKLAEERQQPRMGLHPRELGVVPEPPGSKARVGYHLILTKEAHESKQRGRM